MTSHNTNGMRSRLWPLALLAFSTACSANFQTKNAPPGIISLKLTPRHAELDRRRRERQRHLSDAEKEEEAEAHAEEETETQYRRRDEAVQVGALFEGYGTHYVDLWCGTPPQRQTVIVDTGSGVTAFPCGQCKDCGVPNYHVDGLFVEENSSTFEESTCDNKGDCIMSRSNCQQKKCKIGMAYAEGSRWNAKEVIDLCYVAGPHETPLVAAPSKTVVQGDDMDPRHAAHLAFDMTFGCQDVVTGLFKTQLADGIMGMSNQKSTYWSQMFNAGKMGSDQQFALCFSRPPTITMEGTEAGAMTLGGVDTRLHESPMVYTPNFDGGRSSFFSVKVRRVMLREGKYGESVRSTDINPNKGVTILDVAETELNRGGVIVDSGTTDTYWNSGISKEFGRVFKDITGFDHKNKPMSMNDNQLESLPTILFQLYSDFDSNSHVDDIFKTPGLAGAMDTKHSTDVILAIPPSHYMEYNPETKKFTSRFYPNEHGGSVLGANAMMGHDVFFDVDTKRIGWAESSCNYTHTVEAEGYSFEIDGHLKDLEEVGSGNNNNKNNKDNDSPTTCEEISGGTKCHQKEGCSWGYGKCTTKAGAKPDATASPTEATAPPTGMPTIELSSTGTTAVAFETPEPFEPPLQVEDEFSSLVDSYLNEAMENLPMIGASIGAVTLVLCCIFCLFCKSGRRVSHPDVKYSTVDPSIEMTNGGVATNGDHRSFQDEPDDDDDDVDGNRSRSNGSRTSSVFKDDPEFDGDFA